MSDEVIRIVRLPDPNPAPREFVEIRLPPEARQTGENETVRIIDPFGAGRRNIRYDDVLSLPTTLAVTVAWPISRLAELDEWCASQPGGPSRSDGVQLLAAESLARATAAR